LTADAIAARAWQLPPAPLQTPPSTLPSSGSIITLIPNQPTTDDGERIGDSVTIQLPPGASWTANASNSGQPQAGAAPITWIYAGPGTVNFRWLDASGALQTTQMSFYTFSF